MNDALRIFSGSANPSFSQKVVDRIGVPLGKCRTDRFNDGECNIQVQENIRNGNCFVIQSTCRPVNDNLCELLFMVRTLKRASARYVTAVIPYFGYARQDRKTKPRVPISASDVAVLLEAAGVDRVVSVDLHCGQIQGFFQKVPVDNLFAAPAIVPHFRKKKFGSVTVVSPDAGGVGRAKEFMEALVAGDANLKPENVKLAMIIKQRGGPGQIDRMDLVGADFITGSDCIIVDDIVDTAGTLCKAASLLKDAGAGRVYAVITHAVLSGPALDRIAQSELEELVSTDTIPLPPNREIPKQIKQISVAEIVGEAIRRIHYGESVSGLFMPK